MGMRISPDRRAMLGGKRVLVAEDEAIVAMLVEEELLEVGAEVVGPAGSVGDALHLIEAASREGGLSAAVLDIDLEGEAVTPVADMLAALDVPFVFATGYDSEHCNTGGHGAAPVLHKPFDPDELVVTLAALASTPSRPSPSMALPPLSSDDRRRSHTLR